MWVADAASITYGLISLKGRAAYNTLSFPLKNALFNATCHLKVRLQLMYAITTVEEYTARESSVSTIDAAMY